MPWRVVYLRSLVGIVRPTALLRASGRSHRFTFATCFGIGCGNCCTEATPVDRKRFSWPPRCCKIVGEIRLQHFSQMAQSPRCDSHRNCLVTRQF